MKFETLLDKYTEEFNKYLTMGLSKDDAITLVEKHVKNDINIKTMSPYDLIRLFAGEDVWKKTFDAFDAELDTLLKEISDVLYPKKKVSAETLSQCDAPIVEKKECTCKSGEGNGCSCSEVKKEVIADSPKHKEFRVTYPNGYYKYKMLMK